MANWQISFLDTLISIIYFIMESGSFAGRFFHETVMKPSSKRHAQKVGIKLFTTHRSSSVSEWP
ncbi:hypothetical protein A4S02_10995 [Acetobacter ascendens]|uniref:Uncharacterized protein n=1 Tax=Acetobacter ascendens TaxID=481146 RepID=A0A1D8QXZ5_9PROT|nr:hypothetical protein A4S02_10995 [Acetobacter ascendens]AOW48446.1 hypothetical protein A4R89_02370 [Acetobacter ascendens]RCL09523.1 hypothetical protein BBA71_01850 [Acetobacter pasteurianus]